MCQYSAVDGCATDWHPLHLGQYAVSGAGQVSVEASHVERRGRITHRCLGLYSDENEAALARVVRFFRRHGHARLGIRLSHSGRKGSARRPWQGRGEALTAGASSLSPAVACRRSRRSRSVTLGEGFQLPLAAAVHQAAGLPVMGVGMLFDPLHANRAIAEGRCDLAVIARGMLHDPHLAWRAAAALGGDVSYPPQYIRGYRSPWLRGQRAGLNGVSSAPEQGHWQAQPARPQDREPTGTDREA